jgi:signal transduction histidine kinase
MEGRVSVSSREGKGSTFVVELPLLPVGSREQAVATQSA